MNHFFLETHGKEKVDTYMQEGMRSQAYHRSGASKAALRSMVLRLILIGCLILGILQIVVR